jgi:transposase
LTPVLLETRHVKAALSAMTVKTDRRDARGIAQLLRLGWYRPVHAKSASAQEVRALLTARKLIQGKLLDVESGVRGVLRGFGLKVGPISRGRFEMRILELVDGHAMLEEVIGAMLAARSALEAEFKRLHRALLTLVRDDPVCRQLMSVPGVGAIVAITFKSGVDDPRRFKRSRDVGPHFGLTPRKYQSGELDVTRRITKVGDRMVRTALYEAASVMLTRTVRFSGLKAWAMAVAKRRGTKKARVALARKLAVILHRMWVDGTSFRWAKEETAIA